MIGSPITRAGVRLLERTQSCTRAGTPLFKVTRRKGTKQTCAAVCVQTHSDAQLPCIQQQGMYGIKRGHPKILWTPASQPISPSHSIPLGCIVRCPPTLHQICVYHTQSGSLELSAIKPRQQLSARATKHVDTQSDIQRENHRIEPTCYL